MAMRSIVTSQPDVACDVCGRRLLRGEHPDVFLAGGERRMVCELCYSRATHVGWLREGDAHSLSTTHIRRRGAKTLLGRLRQLREREPRFDAAVESSPEQEQLERELLFLDEVPEEPQVFERPGEEPQVLERPGEEPIGDLKVALAIEIFNASQLPARISGVARALGEPCVTVRALGEASSTVAIVVAWELCWYRYEVDVGDEAAGPRLVAEGMELDQLAREDRVGGVTADELGELAAELA